MPGKMMRRRGLGMVKPAGRLVGRPGILPIRPTLPLLRPVVNPKRIEQRLVRREAARQAADRIQGSRPRPVIRPINSPVKIMPVRPPGLPRARALRSSVSPVLPAAFASATGLGIAAALVAVNTSAAAPDISPEITNLESSLADLQGRASFGEIHSDVINLDNLLKKVVDLLESAREKGYIYQGDLEKAVYDLAGEWQAMRGGVVQNADHQAAAFQSKLSTLNLQLQRLNAVINNSLLATPVLRGAQSQVNSMLDDVSRMHTEIQNSYSDLENRAAQINSRLTTIHWSLEQLHEAKFVLSDDESLVLAVPARWDKEGKEDPEGILYLTNRRLIFEQKEKVATKKILFITTASELVQKVLVGVPLDRLKAVKAENKGLFGHQDYLLVQFVNYSPEAIPFHLDGQDSKEWASLVDRALKGEIEQGMLQSTAGISIKDLTRPISPSDIMALQSEINALQDEAMLKVLGEELVALENAVSSLERQLAGVRAKGYAIEKELEAEVAILAAQWERIKTNAKATLNHQTGLLGEQMQSIQRELARLVGMAADLDAARPIYMQLKSAVASLQAQAEAAEDTVLAQFDEYADEVHSLSSHLEWIDWTLSALSTASFQLMAEESGVAAVEAVYESLTGPAENGILFLTDQRLLWEDRVGDYELKVSIPVSDIINIKKEVGEGENQEYLVLDLGLRGPLPQARFKLGLPLSDSWLKMIGRARSGDYSIDRVKPLSPEELDRIRGAPTQCPHCGAAFSAPLLRGQIEIHCEYCGKVIRL